MKSRSRINRGITISLSWLALVAATTQACKAPDETDPNAPTTDPDNTGTTVPVGTVTDSAGFAVGLVGTRTGTYYLHNATDTTTFTSQCKIPVGTAGAASDVLCYIEAPELDLYFNGLKFVYNVPSTMCTYVKFSAYDYMYNEPGIGPTQVELWVDQNGVQGIDLGNDGTISALAGDTPGGISITAPAYPITGNAFTAASAALISGAIKCNFDHSGGGSGVNAGGNCCAGEYNKRVHVWNKGDATTPAAYDTFNIAESWGGQYSNCLAGAAMYTMPIGTDGFPRDVITLVEGVGLNTTYTVPSAIGREYSTNLSTANYFDPADHGGPAVPAGHVLGYTQPYYEVTCFDEAREINARIRIMVREWNLYSEWLKKGAGDPEVTGFESNPYGTSPIEDILDWSFFSTSYPGYK